MPRLESALLCDYVRVENGLVYVTAGNVDTLYADEVPTARNFGLLMILRLTPAEALESHRVSVVVQSEAGEVMADLVGDIQATPEQPDWPGGAPLSFNFGLVFPDYGQYSFVITLGDEPTVTLPLRVVPPTSS